MAKHSYKFKKQVVMEYLDGKGGFEFLGKKYHLNCSLVKRWVAAYNKFGDDGIKRARQNKTYSFDFKKHVVELYLSGEMSYKDLAFSVGISNPPLITKWVNDYRIAGWDALMPKQKGRRRKMTKPKVDREPINDKDAYLKQLEEENLKLRIENAYLKELRRLRIEEETLLKERQGSSTASEDHTS